MQRISKIQGNQFSIDEEDLLHAINIEVSDLIKANRQLQAKCLMLEGRYEDKRKFLEDLNLVVLLQQKMQDLFDFLLEK